MLIRLLLLLSLAIPVWGQFSSTAHHIFYGAALPTKCSPSTGDVFFITTPTPSPYFCDSTNHWTSMGGSGGATVGKACTITFSNAAFIANSTTADVNCGSVIPANTKVVGITIKHSIAFSGTGITTATIGLGVSGAPLAYSGLALDVFQSTGTAGGKYLDNGGWGSFSMASHQPTVRLTTNIAMGNGSTTVLSTGSVDVWIYTVTLQ